ncbi:MAG: DUF5686 family protein [Bacteroides sp.]|uniref:DUF5686 family protein n=2 Tax=Bacteroides sp. TaxID=29523 RepID=UPI002FC6057C
MTSMNENMKYYFLLLISLLLSLSAFSQVFKGRITDIKGNPVPYASIYLTELKSGFTTDDNGYFKATVKEGVYTCEVSSIGFTGQKFTLRMLPEGVSRDLVLLERTYELSEVRVTNGGEDPAYSIMRHVIANAPYYRTQVKSYTAGTYLKGTGRVKEIPAILKLSKEVRKESKKVLGKLFVMEDQREVHFTAPATWSSRVKAYSNSFPKNMKVDIDMVNINFYAPTLWGKPSPLTAGAFSFYHFKLVGCYVENNRVVNKIQLLPRKGNPKLLSGYLYIIEELWCVSAADLSMKASGLRATVKAVCQEVKPSAYLPTSISMECTIDAFGVKANASYLAAIHYAKVEVNEHRLTAQEQVLQQSSSVASAAPNKKQQKLMQQIEKLSSKEELTIRDAYQLSKLVSRSIEEKDTLRSKHKFERKAVVQRSTVQVDSLADKKDSLYWATVRSVPLRPEELESYKRKELQIHREDSLRKPDRQSDGNGSLSVKSDGSLFSMLLLGHTFQTDSKNAWIKLYGLPGYTPEYNFVDGLWVGAKLSAGVKFSPASSLRFTPAVYYTTARKSVVGSGELVLDYAPRRLGILRLSGGVLSADYNGESGESRLINGVASLLFARNDLKLYDQRFLTVSNQIELANGLLLSGEFSWQKRQMLDNHVAHSIFGKQARTNIPSSDGFVPMPQNQLLKTSWLLQYTPAHYYRMRQGRKVYEDARFPTFTLGYERAFPLSGSLLSPSFHRIELSASQQLEFGLFNSLSWSVNGGTFWGRNKMQFPDYKHFASTHLPVTERKFDDGFFLLDSYAYATTDSWIQAGLSWQTPYLLLKHLPFLRKKSFDEALHLRSLLVHGRKAYTEVGYSVGFANYARMGVFTGFDGCTFRSVGLSISLPLSVFIGNR